MHPSPWLLAMTALELDEGDIYLLAVLTDPSGIEMAEALFCDETQEDAVFRCYDYQYAWWRCEESHQITQCGRSVGKTEGMVMRALAFPFCYAGDECLVTAPEMNHMQRVLSKIEDRLTGMRLFREIMRIRGTGGRGIRHIPHFEAEFHGGGAIRARLPLHDGRGVKGMHPVVLLQDEAQDYPEPGWIELIETKKSATPGSLWMSCGVTTGPGGTFHRLTTEENPDLPFTVHKYMAMHRGTWTDKERRAKVAMYGGTPDNVDYQRNIYGAPGSGASHLFVLSRLLEATRIAESPWAAEYNDRVYRCIKITDDMVKEMPIEAYLKNIPKAHLIAKYKSFWAGLDIGWTRDPSELLVFGECMNQRHPLLRLLLRVHLMRIGAEDQGRAVRAIFDHYGDRLRKVSLDRTGAGLPLYQMMRDGYGVPQHIANRIAGYHFTEKIVVDLEQVTDEFGVTTEEQILKTVVEFGSDELRKLVDARPSAIELPYDTELLAEWQGQVVHYVRDMMRPGSARSAYTGESARRASFHTLDAAKMMIVGRNIDHIEKLLASRNAPNEAVLDRFL
jgi:hypothetical protein